VYICDGCSALARAVVSSGEPVRTEAGWLTATPEREQQVHVPCSFCGKRRDQVAGLAASTAQTVRKVPAAICTECLDLCEEIITEELT